MREIHAEGSRRASAIGLYVQRYLHGRSIEPCPIVGSQVQVVGIETVRLETGGGLATSGKPSRMWLADYVPAFVKNVVPTPI